MTAIVKLTGFSGAVLIDGVQVLSNSANIANEISPSFVNFADIKRDNTPREKVLYAPGTKVSNGSVSFDVTKNALDNLLQPDQLFKRNYYFPVKIFDGNQGKQLSNCLVTSLNLSGATGGLITCNLSFISKEIPTDYDGTGAVFLNPSLTTDSVLPLGYWYSGSTSLQVIDWSLDYSQQVSPVHLNQFDDADDSYPRYLKVQLQSFDLHLSTYDEIDPETNQIIINADTFSVAGTTTGNDYKFSSSGLATFSHDFTGAGVTFPDDTIFSN